jgi:hypothetical protein
LPTAQLKRGYARTTSNDGPDAAGAAKSDPIVSASDGLRVEHEGEDVIASRGGSGLAQGEETMKKVLAMTVMVAGMAVSAASANASTFDFLKDCGDKTRNSFCFTNCETTVTASTDCGSKVNWDKGGLGVLTGRCDSDQIEHNETLWLSFDSPVSIKSITFGNVLNQEIFCWTLNSDGYKLLDGNGCTLESGQIPNGNWCDTGIGSVCFDCIGPVCTIGLKGLDCDDAFKVRSLETCEPCKPCAVPLPAAAWSGLGMLGLLGAGALRKKGRSLLTA